MQVVRLHMRFVKSPVPRWFRPAEVDPVLAIITRKPREKGGSDHAVQETHLLGWFYCIPPFRCGFGLYRSAGAVVILDTPVLDYLLVWRPRAISGALKEWVFESQNRLQSLPLPRVLFQGSSPMTGE